MADIIPRKPDTLLRFSYRCWDCGSRDYSTHPVSRGWLVKCNNCGGWYLIEARRG
jgi:DNA-directed RNA polymerase subunit RPC12/RpoP